jgi:hypothetical protein
MLARRCCSSWRRIKGDSLGIAAMGIPAVSSRGHAAARIWGFSPHRWASAERRPADQLAASVTRAHTAVVQRGC